MAGFIQGGEAITKAVLRAIRYDLSNGSIQDIAPSVDKNRYLLYKCTAIDLQRPVHDRYRTGATTPPEWWISWQLAGETHAIGWIDDPFW